MWNRILEATLGNFLDDFVKDDIKTRLFVDESIDALCVETSYKGEVVDRAELPLGHLLKSIMDYERKIDEQSPTKKEFVAMLNKLQLKDGPLTWVSPVKGDEAVRMYNKYLKVIEYTTETEAGRRLESGYYDFYLTEEEFNYFRQSL